MAGAAISAVLGGGVGLGVYLVYRALRNEGVFASVGRAQAVPSWLHDPRTLRLAGAGAAAVLVALTLQSVVFVLIAAGALWLVPRLRSGCTQREATIARTEAIASWTEMLRDAIEVASGLEDAIRATGPIAPPPIAPEVRRLVQRLDPYRNVRIHDALESFAVDIDHPSADLIVAALVTASRAQAKDLSGLLSSLSAAVRDDARMRVRTEVDRARTRTAAKLIMGVVAATLALVVVFGRGYLSIYSTPDGQVMLLVVAGIFATGLWLMDRMATVELPDRFVIRRQRSDT